MKQQRLIGLLESRVNKLLNECEEHISFDKKIEDGVIEKLNIFTASELFFLVVNNNFVCTQILGIISNIFCDKV